MCKRLPIYLLLLLCVIQVSTLTAQDRTLWEQTPVPEGEYSPHEFIIRMNAPSDPEILKSGFLYYHGVGVDVYQINTKATDFLVRIQERYQKSELGICYREPDVKDPLPCIICEIQANPGGDGPMGNVRWPLANYHLSNEKAPGNNGADNSDGSLWYETFYNLFPNGGYNPFEKCATGPRLPFLNFEDHQEEIDGRKRIAILDTGIDPTNFADFFGSGPSGIVRWSDAQLVPDDESTPTPSLDPHGHGTAAAYLAAHDFVNQGLQDHIRLYSYQVLAEDGAGNLADALFALDQAIQDEMDVISMSFGFIPSNCNNHGQAIFNEYLNDAREEQILVLISSGNQAKDLGSNPQYPAANTFYSNVYTIGAEVCLTQNRWSLSNYDELLVDRLAPGAGLVAPYAHSQQPGGYVYISGTSFSTPLMAGLAANYLLFGDYSSARCRLETNGYPGDPVPVNFDSRKGSVFNIVTDACGTAQNELASPSTGNGQLFEQQQSAPYPNPFNDLLTVSVNVLSDEMASVSVINQQGRTVLLRKSTEPSVSLNTFDLPAGIYFLRVTDDSGSTTRKIVKQ